MTAIITIMIDPYESQVSTQIPFELLQEGKESHTPAHNKPSAEMREVAEPSPQIQVYEGLAPLLPDSLATWPSQVS